jgi:ABC-type lipoprotein release transport system permease subunit
VAAALFATRLMRGMLYEVEPADPVAMTVAVLVLATAAAAASWIPARSGTRVDPMLTMRAE